MTTTTVPGSLDDEQAFLDSVEGEISFFRSIMRARPLGKHRHFHLLLVRNAILRDTGRSVHIETIWDKLRKCYNMDALEAIEKEAAPNSLRSPSPSENLSRHPYFQEEFSLPYDDFEPLIAQRRIRETGSLPSSPAASPFELPEVTAMPASRRSSVGVGATMSRRASGASSTMPAAAAATASSAASTPAAAADAVAVAAAGSGTTRGVKRKLTRSKLNLAGLVGGDSDSSALTQESGDEASGGDGDVAAAAHDKNNSTLNVPLASTSTATSTPALALAAAMAAETPRGSVVTGTSVGTDGGDGDGRTDDGEEEDNNVEMVMRLEGSSPAREASPKPTRGRNPKTGADRGRRGRGGAAAAAVGARGATTRGKKKQKR